MNESLGIPDNAATSPPELIPPACHLPVFGSLKIEIGSLLETTISFVANGEFMLLLVDVDDVLLGGLLQGVV